MYLLICLKLFMLQLLLIDAYSCLSKEQMFFSPVEDGKGVDTERVLLHNKHLEAHWP